MSDVCRRLHSLFHKLPILCFPLNMELIPSNGIYVMFERGEMGHKTHRVVRVGTHTGDNQLQSRMKQHFINENKDRSIFRKHVGRALLNRDDDPFIEQWNLDLTSSAAKNMYRDIVDFEKQQWVEEQVTDYIQTNLSFVCFPIDGKSDRLHWETKIIAAVARCAECSPSPDWLGLCTPNPKICESGLWLVQGLNKEPLSEGELEDLKHILP